MLTTPAAGDRIEKCVLENGFRKERLPRLSDDELAVRIAQARRKVVGTKQTLKALESGEAVLVILARDAEEKVTAPVAFLAGNRGVEIGYLETMSVLGKSCGIKVNAATAAIIEF